MAGKGQEVAKELRAAAMAGEGQDAAEEELRNDGHVGPRLLLAVR